MLLAMSPMPDLPVWILGSETDSWFSMRLQPLPLVLMGCWEGWVAKFTPRRFKNLQSTGTLSCEQTDCTSSAAAWQAWEVSQGDKRAPSGQSVCQAANQKRICTLFEVPPSRITVLGPRVRTFYPHLCFLFHIKLHKKTIPNFNLKRSHPY